jgi:hypothetical protein
MLWVGAFLVLFAGIQLYFLTEHTERWFSWTIDVPLTAAFLGASSRAADERPEPVHAQP